MNIDKNTQQKKLNYSNICQEIKRQNIAMKVFCEKLGIDEYHSQTINNWKSRGFPDKHLAAAAKILKVTVEQLTSPHPNGTKEPSSEYGVIPPKTPLEEKNWNALPVKLRALLEDLLNKHASGLLTEDHIKILQNMADALTQQPVIRQQQQQSQDMRKSASHFIEMIEKTCEK